MYDKLGVGLAQGVSTPLVNQMRVLPVHLLRTLRSVPPELCAHLVRQLDAAGGSHSSTGGGGGGDGCANLTLSQQPVDELLTMYDNYARLVLYDMWVAEAAVRLSEALKGDTGSDDVESEDEDGERGAAAAWTPDGDRNWDRIEQLETRVAHLLACAPFSTRRDPGGDAEDWSAPKEAPARLAAEQQRETAVCARDQGQEEGREEASASGFSGASREQGGGRGRGQGRGGGSADRGARRGGEPRARILQALAAGPSRVAMACGCEGAGSSSSSGSSLHVILDSAWVNASEGEGEELATALLLARLLPRDRGGLARVLVRGPEALSLLLFTLTDDLMAGTPVVQPVWAGQADAKEVRGGQQR